jgi:hypothetical protein
MSVELHDAPNLTACGCILPSLLLLLHRVLLPSTQVLAAYACTSLLCPHLCYFQTLHPVRARGLRMMQA